MQGIIFKMAAISLLLLSTLSFATPSANSADSNIYNSKRGCMACHQGDMEVEADLTEDQKTAQESEQSNENAG